MTWYILFPSLVKVKKKYLYSLRLKKLDIVEFFWAVFFLNLSLVQEIDRISCDIVDWSCVTALNSAVYWTAKAWSTGYVENN